MLGLLFLAISTRYKFCDKFSSVIYLLDLIFSIKVSTNRLHGFDKGICFPATAAMKMGKKHFYSAHGNGC